MRICQIVISAGGCVYIIDTNVYEWDGLFFIRV